jgi:ketosteroid isomerase-like protein
MQILIRLAVALALACGGAGAASAAAKLDDVGQIEALEQGFGAAFTAKDVDKIMSFYAKDNLFVFDLTPPRERTSWNDYRKDWQDFFAGNPGPAGFTLTELNVTAIGTVAFSHGIQDAFVTAGNGSKAEVISRVTRIYRKTAGKWLIVEEHVSVPVDLATMKPDLQSKP